MSVLASSPWPWLSIALCHARRVACTRAWFPCEHLPLPHPFFGWLRRQREKSGGGMLCSLEKLRCDLSSRTTLKIVVGEQT